MEHTIIIRPATISDMDVLYEFEQGIINYERAFDPCLPDYKIHYYDLKAMLRQEHVYIAVAEVENKIVGSGYARIEASKPYLKHKEHAYLGFMFVHPEYRGLGINSRIIEALKAWAVSKNITELRLEVYAANASAIQAYRKAGFSEHLVQMRMGLG